MSETVRQTHPYRLHPTPVPAQVLEAAVWRCRTLDTCALEQRRTWCERGQGVGASCSKQKAELPDLKAAHPEFTDVQSPVAQDVLLLVERT